MTTMAWCTNGDAKSSLLAERRPRWKQEVLGGFVNDWEDNPLVTIAMGNDLNVYTTCL
jgi:hypothetical protein